LHLALHDFELGKRTLGIDLLQPLFKESQLGAFRHQFCEIRLLKEFDDCIAPSLDLAHRFQELTFCQENRSLSPSVHHQHVGTKLLKAPDQFIPHSMCGNEVKKVKIALGIANYAGEIVDLKKTEITMVILNALLL